MNLRGGMPNLDPIDVGPSTMLMALLVAKRRAPAPTPNELKRTHEKYRATDGDGWQEYEPRFFAHSSRHHGRVVLSTAVWGLLN
jgi:hypothetical protein